jgi:hypothetical protein
MSDGRPSLTVVPSNLKNSLSDDDTLFSEDFKNPDALRAMTNRLKLDRPRNSPKQQGTPIRSGSTWRITLTLADDPIKQKVVTIQDNAVLGAYPPNDPRVQVSLEDWDARNRGVSRTHAAIRTGPTRLLLLDLGSTNGTFLNSVPVGRGWAHTLADGDLLTLGALSLWVHIIEQPG